MVPLYLFPLQLLGIGGKVNSTMRGENSSPRPASHLLFSSVIISKPQQQTSPPPPSLFPLSPPPLTLVVYEFCALWPIKVQFPASKNEELVPAIPRKEF